MPQLDVFGKRGVPLPATFVYDELPDRLRYQLVYWLEEYFPPSSWYSAETLSGSRQLIHLYERMSWAVCKEYGIPHLCADSYQDKSMEVYDFIKGSRFDLSTAIILALVEMFAHYLVVTLVNNDEAKMIEAVTELNHRFRENGVGYQFEIDAKEIIRLDNTLLHQEVIQPTLHLLTDPVYESANDEFLKALKSYKQREFEACILKCCQAQESVMKIICNAKGWIPDVTKATAHPLVEAIIKHGNLADII